ncbi:MAG: SUMF1/EgtB/PvdO family nonheme iron enzyme [Bacteroidota bacterium]
MPAAFPKGFNAFYCMKYETSQDQWIGFFNTLSQTQKMALDITGPEGKNSDDEFIRNAISWLDAGNATTTNPDVPVSYVASSFALAYLDWSGLRPMTELEYEKACRGTLAPVPNEFAWGNFNIHPSTYTYANEGSPQEAITNPGSGAGNCLYQNTNGTPSGPKRCGIVAASALLNNREETGGSYYGIMEMSGNLYERAVTVGTPEGRTFTGLHGDGAITNAGAANVAGWTTNTNTFLGFRGGGYPNGDQFIRVSDRNDAALDFSGTNGRIGFRGVRTAE